MKASSAPADLLLDPVLWKALVHTPFVDCCEMPPWVLASPLGELLVIHCCFHDNDHTETTFPLSDDKNE